MFAITDPEGNVLAAFATEEECHLALLTDEYPEDAAPAFIN